MRICALVAAFNEEASVAAVVAAVNRHVPDVVVVDDGSTDRTAQQAAGAGAVVVARPANGGKGSAVRTGLERVLAGDYTHVLLLDADFQHDPDDIPRLVAEADRGDCDVVLAERRFVKGQMPTARFYSNRIGSWILSRFIGMDIDDTQCGFRLLKTSILRGLPLRSTGYEVETEMLIKLARRHAIVGRIPIPARYEGARSKLRSVRDTVRTCLMAVKYRYLDRE